jgi:hypothetical protein
MCGYVIWRCFIACKVGLSRLLIGHGATMFAVGSYLRNSVFLVVAAWMLSGQSSAPVPLLFMREETIGMLGCPFSELTVLSDGQVTQVVCGNACRGANACRTRFRVWETPGEFKQLSTVTIPLAGTETRRVRLSPNEVALLKVFLDSDEVKNMRPFLSAGGGSNNYQIVIPRGNKIQVVPVTCLIPSHPEADPALLRVICRAKMIAGKESPDWCTTKKVTR